MAHIKREEQLIHAEVTALKHHPNFTSTRNIRQYKSSIIRYKELRQKVENPCHHDNHIEDQFASRKSLLLLQRRYLQKTRKGEDVDHPAHGPSVPEIK